MTGKTHHNPEPEELVRPEPTPAPSEGLRWGEVKQRPSVDIIGDRQPSPSEGLYPPLTREEFEHQREWLLTHPQDGVGNGLALRIIATLEARQPAPSAASEGRGLSEGLSEDVLQAIRGYGDARADVASGRATRKAIDHAWDTLLTVSRTPPMDRRQPAPSEGLDVERLARAITHNWRLLRTGETPLYLAQHIGSSYAKDYKAARQPAPSEGLRDAIASDLALALVRHDNAMRGPEGRQRYRGSMWYRDMALLLAEEGWTFSGPRDARHLSGQPAPSEGLDVERLSMALRLTYPTLHLGRDEAETLAREYARQPALSEGPLTEADGVPFIYDEGEGQPAPSEDES